MTSEGMRKAWNTSKGAYWSLSVMISLMSAFATLNDMYILSSSFPLPFPSACSIPYGAELALPLCEPSNLMSFHGKVLSSLSLL